MDKKISPANHADENQSAVQNFQAKNSTGNENFQQPVQILENLPQELLTQQRFFPVGADKIPRLKDWSNPDKQKHYNEIEGYVGFDTCGHDRADDYLFLDFDHIFNDKGKFVNVLAEQWFNMVVDALKTYCELSASLKGAHVVAVPTKGKFSKVASGKNGRIYFDDEKKSFVEIFYGTGGRYCFFTGNVYRCEPKAPVAHGQAVDNVFKTLLDEVALQNKKPSKSTQQKPIAPAVYQSIDSPDFDIWRAEKMLEVIRVADLSREDWLNVGMALKNNGNTCADWEQWSRPDDRFKDGECEKLWQGFNGGGLTIATIHDLAKQYGYSEKDAQSEWYKLHPELPKKTNKKSHTHRVDSPAPIELEHTGNSNAHDDDQPTDDEPRTRDFIPDCPINAHIPINFNFSNSGIKYIAPPKRATDEPKVTQVTRTPIVITKVFTETKNFETQYEVAMKIDKAWRFITVDGRTLQDPRRVLDLAGTGALIEAPPILAKYFIRFIAINRDAITKTKVYSQPGWHDDQFIYPTGGEDYICSRSNINYDELFSAKGDFDTWKKKFHEISCSRNGALKRAALGAFWLPPLLRILHLPNFWLHLQGKKNFAKTPLIKFGLSIYGNPAETYLLRTFDSSPKNRVTMAVAMNDLPQAIDELETLSAKETAEIQKSVYDYVSGMDGQKNQKSGDVRPVTRFRGVRISTGERPILDQNAKGGAIKRCITLHITEPLFNDEEARQLHIFCEKNHGHCGKLWTAYVARHEEEIFADFERLLADLSPEFKEFEPAHVRAIAGCTVAFWHARKCFGLEANFDAYHAKADVSLITRLLPTQEEISDTNRGIDLLASWTNEHPKNFASYGDKTGTLISATSFTETSGIQFPDGRVAFFPNAFKRICEEELHLPSYEKFLNELYDEGKLICPSRREKAKQIKISGHNTRVYLFKAEVLLATDTDEEGNTYNSAGE